MSALNHDGQTGTQAGGAGAVLVCPCGGTDRLSPYRISRLLQGAKARGRLIDVSMSGAALHLTEEFTSGTRIALRVVNSTLNKHVEAAATVLRCTPDGEAGWNVVCRFDRNLTFEQIHVIGQDLFASTIV